LNAIGSFYIEPGGNFFIARNAATNNVAGFVGIKYELGGVGSLKRMAVMENYRRQGVGLALARTATRWAFEHGISKITLGTGIKENAKPIYEAVGFVTVGMKQGQDGKDKDFLMELDFERQKPPFTIEVFDGGQAAMQEIAEFDLAIKKGVEADTDKRFDDIRAGYRELQKLDEIYESPGRFWVARGKQGKLIGCVGLKWLDDSKGYVGRLGVARSHRRQGVSRKLMTELVTYADSMGFDELTLGTHTSQNAVKLYEELGFHRTDEREDDGDIVMRRYATISLK
jgi:GNAT superfamily N-acetyltransferase